jgi:hypothetical protein
MNEKTESIVGAIGGNAEGAENGGAPDYKALYEEMQKKLQSEKVEAGRLKKEAEENAALRKQIEELKKSKRLEDAISALPEDLKDEVPDDLKRGSAIIAHKAVDMAMQDANARLAKLEEERELERRAKSDLARRELDDRLATAFPGFGRSIAAGGDKHDAWIKYQERNAQTLKSAIESSDFDTLKYHIEMFYKNLDLPLPSGDQGGSAAPEPRAMGGGVESQAVVLQPGKTYTAKEYQRILEDAQAKFQRHILSYKEYVGICDELSKAYKEGRVK